MSNRYRIRKLTKDHWYNRGHSHPCCDSLDANQELQAPYHHVNEHGGTDTIVDTYSCPRGHEFQSSNPLVIAVESNPDYNSGPVCSFCLVDWYRNNVNAELKS
jgi:hypothetical protein